VSEGTNRNMPDKNTLVQLLAVYTNPESHNAQHHRHTDGQQDDANSRSYCVAVRSAKKQRNSRNSVITMVSEFQSLQLHLTAMIIYASCMSSNSSMNLSAIFSWMTFPTSTLNSGNLWREMSRNFPLILNFPKTYNPNVGINQYIQLCESQLQQ